MTYISTICTVIRVIKLHVSSKSIVIIETFYTENFLNNILFRLEFERKRAIKAERDRVRDDENSVKAEKAKQKEVSYGILINSLCMPEN